MGIVRNETQVFLVEDQEDIGCGLAELIAESDDFVCAGAFESLEPFFSFLHSRAPPSFQGVALIDLGLPGMSGVEGIRKLKGHWESISPMVLTVYDDDTRIMEAVCAGANGYLLKNTPPERLLESIRESADGGSPMSPAVARRVVELFRKAHPAPQSDCALTPHESRVLNLLVAGENYKTAAAKLGVTVHAVSFHVRRIYEKLQVHSRTEAVAKALRIGLSR